MSVLKSVLEKLNVMIIFALCYVNVQTIEEYHESRSSSQGSKICVWKENGGNAAYIFGII